MIQTKRSDQISSLKRVQSITGRVFEFDDLNCSAVALILALDLLEVGLSLIQLAFQVLEVWHRQK